MEGSKSAKGGRKSASGYGPPAESLFTMRKPLLRDSFKSRLSLDRNPDAILIFILKARFDPRRIKNMMRAMNKPV